MAMILEVFLSNFSELLMQMVQDEVGMLLGIPGQIEKLGETVHDIQCVLADAERKQSKSSAIERWLMQLKDVMYEARDVIDLCQIKAKERLTGSSRPLLSRFCNMLSARRIRSKIKNINSRLEEIAKRKADLGLIESPIFRRPFGRPHRVDSMINCTVVLDIVGEKIEEDAQLLVNWLIDDEEKGVSENVCVAAIVGMRGIGKTTLAIRIFNDPRILEEFQLKIWVCVSKEVKGVELLKYLIREAGGEHGAAQERWELVSLLKRLIQGKKFLLVLDDVWEESRAVWDDLLRAPMSGGAHGSRLLVTTRDERVANGMRAAKSHRVDKLSEEDGWSLLTKQVAPIRVESEIQDLKDIGMQIVKKCDSLPLAIKSIGGVLCMKGNTRSNWQVVLSSMDEPQGDVYHALYLSYEDLPLPLKQCLIFCSLFPKDFVFHKSNLIYMWLAEDFLQDKGDFWEFGNEYYMELLLQNLLEVVGPSYDQGQCKMHDTLWSFSRQLGKDENCVLGEGQVLSRSEESMNVQRLLINGNELNTQVIKKAKGLRTLLLHFRPEIALDDMCKAFSKLRILDLNHPNFSSIPDSLCDLVHLRYLNVSGSNIRNLPNSIGNLRNLVYLNVANCEELSHLPRSIINLRELKLLNTYNSGVETIPAGLIRLGKLIELYGFKPYHNNFEGFSSLDELETLSQLLILEFDCLENVSDINIAKRANLQIKNMLHNLYLKYTSLSPEEQLSQTNEKKMTTEDVLNELLPPISLEILKIEGYFGSHLPKWFNPGAHLPNLRFLHINNCACFEVLSPLGQLPNLDFLQIIGACSVVSVGEEFFGGCIQSRDAITTSYPAKPAFPKLIQLIFDEMSNWKTWNWNKGQQAMPKLKELCIRGCPQLETLPEGLLHHATSLEYLEIHGADQLITIENLPSVKDIHVSRNPNLERISNLDSASFIVIYDCPNLKAVENLKVLETMALTDFGMKILPDYLMKTMPQELRIHCSEELLLEIATQRERSFEWHKFENIHTVKIHSYSGHRSFWATYQKTPFSFTTNVRTRSVQK